MKVTVAIITKNRTTQLKRCLKSLTKQTIKSFQVLVVDNNSTDNTKETVESFRDTLNIRYVFEPKTGRSNARNRVLKEANGDILASIDDDCEVAPAWIESIKKVHKQFPDAAAIQGWSISKPKNGAISIISQYITENSIRNSILWDDKKNDSFGNVLKDNYSITLVDTKCASFRLPKIKNNNIHFNASWHWSEDLELSKQMLAKGLKIMFSPEIHVYHWERLTVLEFLKQKFYAGMGVEKTYHYWHKFFPKKRSLWEKTMSFPTYVLQNNYLAHSFLLLPLFILQRIAYGLGVCAESILIKFKSAS